MTNKDLKAIAPCVHDAFNSMGIVSPSPKLGDGGVIEVECGGICQGDSLVAADRIAQSMGWRGREVDVWYNAESNMILINDKEKENSNGSDDMHRP